MQVTSLLLCVSPAEESPDVSLMTLRLGERPSRKKHSRGGAGRTQTAPWRTATSHLACENLEMLENVFGHPLLLSVRLTTLSNLGYFMKTFSMFRDIP